MNKKALLALCIALIIPLIGYFGLKYEGGSAVTMPGKYLLDSVTTKVENGKISTDSIWHTVQNIRLVNQLGDTVNLYDIKDKVIVADFFFTGCASICPVLTRNMVRLQRSFEKNKVQNDAEGANRVQFLSFTIDPIHDSVMHLKRYADRYGVNSDNWWFLTGNKDSIYNFIFQQLKVDKYNDTIPISPYFPHTARFVLLDRDFHIRGYYNGLDTVESLPKLAHDISLLMVEKDKAHPGALPFDPVEMGVIFLIAFILVLIIARLIFGKKRNLNDSTK